MPINNFDGNTFVAFTDICGFKLLMSNRKKAIKALQHFYQTGFDIIQNQLNNTPIVEGFFISDCAVLFVRDGLDNHSIALKKLLKAVEELNNKMLEKDLILTTSICFGYFKYEGKFEISGTEKNQIFGDAYVEVFLDNEVGKPKIRPGECRILIKNIPEGIENTFSTDHDFNRLIKKGNHYYFYWMVNSANEIDDFIRRYNDVYNLQFQGMIKALKERS